jgi:hypothetical protein
MPRGQKVFFRASKGDLDRLYACNRESSLVMNECLRLAKEHFLQHGCWITKSCKIKRKGSSLFTANRFKQSATNISSQDNLLPTRFNMDMLPVTPTRKSSTSQRNGQKTVSKCMKTEKSNYLWAFITENGKSRSSCMRRICPREPSKKSNAAGIKVFIWQ